MNLDCYETAQLAGKHFIYGLANGNECATVQLYGEIYPMRMKPNHQTFARVHPNLAEHEFSRATIKDIGWPQTALTTIFEESVLHALDRNPGISAWTFTVATGRSRTTVHRELLGETLHVIHVQRVQLLLIDYRLRRVTFAQWFGNQSTADMYFTSSELYCDETPFSF